jgi:tetratricopeptide (TPR) repeat protein
MNILVTQGLKIGGMKALFSLSLSLLLLAPGALAQEALWHDYFDSGKASIEKGDFEQAEKQLSAALSNTQRMEHPESATIATIKELSSVYVAERKYDQAAALLQKLVALDEKSGEKADLCTNLRTLGQIVHKQGNLSASATYLHRAVELARSGATDTATLSSLMVEEAVICEQDGAISKVEPLLLEVLKLRTKELQPNDLSVISCVEHLADFYTSQSRYTEAEPLYKRCIAAREKLPANQNTALLRDLVSLGKVEKEQGKRQEAEKQLKEAVSMAEKQFGSTDPEVAIEVIGLAKFYCADDRPSMAVPLLDRAIAIRAGAFRETDPRIADVFILMGEAYMDKDNYPLAEKNFTRALDIDEQNKQDDQLRVARDLSSIGKLQLSQGKYKQAEDAYKRALEITRNVRGADHPDTATSMNNLAFLARNQNNYREAESLLRKALAIREKAFGANHPVVAQNLINLADVLAASDRPSEAEPLLLRALSIDSDVLGADHEYVSLILRDLIEVLKAQTNKDLQAEKYSRRLLARDSRIVGNTSLLAARDMDSLANILIGEGKILDAKELKRSCAEILKQSAIADLDSNNQVQKSATVSGQPVKDKWALVIGISSFQDPALNLKYAAKDATDFRNFLITEAHFKPDHVKLLTDQDATRANIVALLGDKWLKKVANPDDLTVIYISGHGTQSAREADGANFIVPYEGNVENIVFSGLPMQWLLAGLKNLVKSDRTYVFLDVCHSGAAAREKEAMSASSEVAVADSSSKNSPDEKSLTRFTKIDSRSLTTATGQVVVAASQADQVSWESKRYANGVFTRSLIKGLKINGDHTTMGQAYDYLRNNVEDEVLRDRAQLQTPVIVPKVTQGTMTELCGKPIEPRSASLEGAKSIHD